MKTDQLNRRLRSAPPNPGARPKTAARRLVLQEADYAMFEAIDRHGPLPTHYLFEFQKHLRADYTNVQNRLTEFYNGTLEGAYLSRPERQFAGYEARYQHLVYDLTPRGRQLLAERGTLSRFAPRRTDPFLHQLMQACVSASFELTAASLGLRYISREEILTHDKCAHAVRESGAPMAIPLPSGERMTIVPDDLFGLEYPGVGYRFFAVEIDRNTESIERSNLGQNAFGRKVLGYLDVLKRQAYRAWWGVPNLTVLIVTTNATHGSNILEFVRRQIEPDRQDRFALRCEASFGANWRVPRKLLSQLLRDTWSTPKGVRDIARP